MAVVSIHSAPIKGQHFDKSDAGAQATETLDPAPIAPCAAGGTPPPPDWPPPGPPPWKPPLLERYTLIRKLGEGGMGVVYLAHDKTLDRYVAIKFLHEPNKDLRKRLLKEARALARIEHRNVVTIYDIVEQDENSYFTSEYLPGKSLAQCGKPMAWTDVLQHGIAIASGLAAVHAQKLLHRDIKPANVILTDAGDIKMIDFGLATRQQFVRQPEAERRHDDRHAITCTDAQDAYVDTIRAPATRSSGNSLGLAGTPPYMAPELWDGAKPTPRSDIYSCGVLLYELCMGEIPPDRCIPAEYNSFRHFHDHIDVRFRAVIARCLHTEPARRYASGAELEAALQSVQGALHLPHLSDNPYRGLRPFDREHRHIFFGRERDTARVLGELRKNPFVVVSGESGVGKSSLVRAGVLPSFQGDRRMDGRSYEVLTVMPGRTPLAELARVLARRYRMDEVALLGALCQGQFTDIEARMRAQHRSSAGTVLFIDQMEELYTLGKVDSARLAGQLVAYLVQQGIDGLRILATLRGDYRDRLIKQPGIGPLLRDTLPCHLDPMTRDGIRKAIVEPARSAGVDIEPAAVEELVATAYQHEGGLPLLQFVLAELWDKLDRDHPTITRQAIASLGGVEGALARHADKVVHQLDSDKHRAARALLVQLVTPRRTRRRCTGRELGLHDHRRRHVLEILIDSRLVIAHNHGGDAVYEIAHEALVMQWPTLTYWLDMDSGIQYIKERLSAAAKEWQRLGRGSALLWSPEQLVDAEPIVLAELPDLDRTFLIASRRAVIRRRRMRKLMVVLLVVALVLGYMAIRYNNALQRRNDVDNYLQATAAILDKARAQRAIFDRQRNDAAAHFQQDQGDQGLRIWQQSLAGEPTLDALYQQASYKLELALERDPGRADVREAMAALIDERARFAAELGRHGQHDELMQRLSVYSGSRHAAWTAPVDLQVRVASAGATLRVERYKTAPRAVFEHEYIDSLAVESGSANLELAPGSYLLTATWPDTDFSIRYPVLLRPGAQPREIAIARPARFADMAETFAFVPEGWFLSGFGRGLEDEGQRAFYESLPLHERRTDAYWIARHETTYDQWLAFLAACGPRKHCPGSGPSDEHSGFRVSLDRDDNGTWALAWTDSTQTLRATSNQAISYGARAHNTVQNWRNMPVVGLSPADIEAYLAWLRHSNRVPGARLCREDEWERAARGADDRSFPHGTALRPEDANFDLTYDRIEGAYGPDEVGSHSRSISPFGVYDMAGNVWELTAPSPDPSTGARRFFLRGGSFYHSVVNSHVANHWLVGSEARMPIAGFRVCADAAPSLGLDEI